MIVTASLIHQALHNGPQGRSALERLARFLEVDLVDSNGKTRCDFALTYAVHMRIGALARADEAERKRKARAKRRGTG